MYCHTKLMFFRRSGEYGCTAYVTFKGAYGLETAILLSVSCRMSQRKLLSQYVEKNNSSCIMSLFSITNFSYHQVSDLRAQFMFI